MEIRSDPTEYDNFEPPFIMIHALKNNKRPIGFAPWPKQKKPKSKKKVRRKK